MVLDAISLQMIIFMLTIVSWLLWYLNIHQFKIWHALMIWTDSRKICFPELEVTFFFFFLSWKEQFCYLSWKQALNSLEHQIKAKIDCMKFKFFVNKFICL